MQRLKYKSYVQVKLKNIYMEREKLRIFQREV